MKHMLLCMERPKWDLLEAHGFSEPVTNRKKFLPIASSATSFKTH